MAKKRVKGWTGAPVQSPWWAGWRLSVALLAFVITGGTLGYVVIEGWSPWEALYMTMISITTVGYKEVHPMSRAGELFTMGVLTVGVATVLYTFSTFMARLVEGDLQHRWVRRRRERMLDELEQHFIVCGFGRIGRIISGEFARQGVPFVIIERSASASARRWTWLILPSRRTRRANRCCAVCASVTRADSSPRSVPTPKTYMPS